MAKWRAFNVLTVLSLALPWPLASCQKVKTTYSTNDEEVLLQDPVFPAQVIPSTDLDDFEAESLGIFNQLRRDYDSRKTQTKQCQRPDRFQENSPTHIRFAIGYEDSSPKDIVTDLMEMNHLERWLTRPCVNSASHLCGFQVERNSSARRVLKRISPEEKTLIITLTTSSVSTSDAHNQKQADQIRKSRWATEQFLSAFEEEDVVIYWGHGRGGGGPDFAPPLRNKNNEVVLPSYQRVRRGYNLIQSGLGSRYRRATHVGLFGCGTAAPSATIRERHPDISFAVSLRDITYAEMVSSSLAYLNSILSRECHPKAMPGFSYEGPF